MMDDRKNPATDKWASDVLAAARNHLSEMLGAINSGNIESPDISDEDGQRRWHEEWAHYAAEIIARIDSGGGSDRAGADAGGRLSSD